MTCICNGVMKITWNYKTRERRVTKRIRIKWKQKHKICVGVKLSNTRQKVMLIDTNIHIEY